MDLVDKIRKIEALLASATSEGERQAAELARERLQNKIVSEPIEYAIRLKTAWSKRLFVALCQKYQLTTYRYARQKYTMAMVRVSRSFMNDVLWPIFNRYHRMLEELTDEILQDLISKIHEVKEEDERVIAGELPMMQEISAL